MRRDRGLEELALLGLIAAVLAVWLELWVRWLLRVAAPDLPGPPLLPGVLWLLTFAGGLLTRRVLRQPHWSLRRVRAAVGGAGAAAVGLALWLALAPHFRGEAWYSRAALADLITQGTPVFAACLVAWWQGLATGRATIAHHNVLGAFHTGVLALAGLLVANALWPVYTGADVLAGVLAFFSFGLSGLAIASLRRLVLWQRAVATSSAGYNRYWLLTVATVMAVVLGGGLLAARVLAPEAFQRLADRLARVGEVIALVAGVVIAPVAFALAGLLAPLFPFLARLVHGLADVFNRIVALAGALVGLLLRLAAWRLPELISQEQMDALLSSPGFQSGVRWSLVLSGLLVVALVAWLAVRRVGLPVTQSEDETRESIFNRQLLWAQLLALLRGRRRRAPLTAPAPYLALAGPPDDARTMVRRAYRVMLEWASSLSLPRAAGQTPHAYAQQLAGAVPQGQAAIIALTRLYQRARYSAEPPSLEEAHQAAGAAAWLSTLAGMVGEPRPASAGARPTAR